METRTCRDCGQDKPATREFFRVNPKCAGGITNLCKECYNAGRRKEPGAPAPARPAPIRKPAAPAAPAPARQYTAPAPAPAVPKIAAGPRVPEPAGTLREGPRVTGPRYQAPTWKKTGLIVRAEFMELIKNDAWRHREDITECLDRILGQYFGAVQKDE